MTLLWPAITLFVLIYLIAFWAIFVGISHIFAAFHARREMADMWLLGLVGLLSLLFGLLILFRPAPDGILAITGVIGSFALLAGFLYLFLAFNLRKKCKASMADTRGNVVEKPFFQSNN